MGLSEGPRTVREGGRRNPNLIGQGGKNRGIGAPASRKTYHKKGRDEE